MTRTTRPVTLPSDRLGSLKRKAKREGWLKYILSAADEAAMLNGCTFDIARAEHVEEFFAAFLRHSQGSDFAGKPFTLLDWQRDKLFYPLFGWIKTNERGNQVRRYRKAYVEIPKKNGKSTIASGVGLYMLCADGEPGAEIYSAATDRTQANIVHREAVNMIEQSPQLSKVLDINRSTWNIQYKALKSFYRALASKPQNNEGFKAHCIIADELHAWTGQKGRDLYDALRWAFASRTQPLFFQITTAGQDLLSVCGEQHEYAKQIIEGKAFDDAFFGFIAAADPNDDPFNPDTWKKANPSLGQTMTLESFAGDALEASKTPSGTARHKRYRLNIWTTGDDAWLPMPAWEAKKVEFDESSLAGRTCFAGLDLSRTQDTTSLQLIFPPEVDGGDIHLLSYFWLPEKVAKELVGVVPYTTWAEQGLITLTPGNVVDYSFIERKFGQLSKLFHIARVGYDKTYAEDVTQRLEASYGVEREIFAQSIMNFAAPTAEWERLVINDGTESTPAPDLFPERTAEIAQRLLELTGKAPSPEDGDENGMLTLKSLNGRLIHNGHAIMNWQLGNVRVKVDASGNKRPVKPNNPMDRRKIDGPVAAIMALALAMKYGFMAQRSFYENHDVEFG